MICGYKIAALCISRVNEDSHFKFTQALNRSLEKHGYRLFVFNTCSDLVKNSLSEYGECYVFDLIDYDIVDTVIIDVESLKNSSVINNIVSKAVSKNVPRILIDGNDDRCVNINFDYESGFEEIVRHMIEVHKPETVHFLSGIEGNSFTEMRNNIFRKVASENGYDVDDSMISYGQFWADPAKLAVEKLIREDRVPRAIICANDVMAITASSVLQQNGYKVPDDVLISGFDGIDEIRYSNPNITSCHNSWSDMANKIAQLADDLNSGVKCEKHYVVGSSLIMAQSCGCMDVPVASASDLLARLNSHFAKYMDDDIKLFEMSAKMHICKTIEQASGEILLPDTNNIVCLINDECTDESIHPLTRIKSRVFSSKMFVLYDSRYNDEFKPYGFPQKQIVPGLENIFATGYPLIFSALHYLDIPLGYMCYYFIDSQDYYYKIIQITNSISNGISGLRNMRYQSYITGQIEEMYKLDSLTGMYNRNGFNKEFRKITQKMSRVGGFITVISADLDGLKTINDNYGHEEGDNAISAVAAAILASMPPSAVCMRFGGDEMVAVIPEKCDTEAIKDSIHSYLEAHNKRVNKPYKVSTSLGIYSCECSPGSTLDFENLLKNSDKLLYLDKATRKLKKG